jgi:hypothetical protein
VLDNETFLASKLNIRDNPKRVWKFENLTIVKSQQYIVLLLVLLSMQHVTEMVRTKEWQLSKANKRSSYQKDVADNARSVVQSLGIFHSNVVQVQTHSREKIFRLADIHPEP